MSYTEPLASGGPVKPDSAALAEGSARPLYIESARGGVFAVFHSPSQPRPARAAVLICAPWGWDDVASYRPRRALALRLAAGHPTLRFDLLGSGNSAGSPRDPDLLTAWLDSVTAAAAWLGRESRAPVAALGLGLGGLLALQAATDGAAIDELVLWAAPVSGAAYVREVRKFARLQAWQKGAGGEDAEGAAPGWIEASGFLLAPGTLAALERVEPQPRRGGRLRRALLLGRNGVEADAGLQQRLRDAGIEVDAGPGRGRGWGAMVSHPERSRLPDVAAGEIETWLGSAGAAPSGACEGDAPDSGSEAEGAGPAATDELTLDFAGSAVVETPISIPSPDGEVFAILTTPAADADSALCAVFFNAGGVRNVGPNRMWLERSRAWAARGVNCARIDLTEIGEGGGDPDGIPPGPSFFAEKFEEQAEAALAALRERGLGTRFLLVGLCSGAYFSFRTALRDETVVAATLINAGALVFYPELLDEREARKASRALQPQWISKLLKGEVPLSKVRALIRPTLVGIGRKLRDGGRARRQRRARRNRLEADLDQLRGSSTRLALAFSGGEPIWDELEAIDFAAIAPRWPNLELIDLPGEDHTLRPVAAQAALREVLDAELERARAAAG